MQTCEQLLSSSMVRSLCKSPAIDGLVASDVALLLKDAVKMTDSSDLITAALCGLPAADTVSVSPALPVFVYRLWWLEGLSYGCSA